MKKNEYNDLRKYANRLCVHHGLSIIDLQSLRHNDPAYSAWVDSVIADGKITVHPEAEEHKGARRQKASTQDIYYKWLRDTEEFNAAEEQRLTEAQRNSKKAAQTYFWDFEDHPKKRPYYIRNDPKKRFYAVKRYDENGRQRSLVELIIMLLVVICSNEIAVHGVQQGEPDYMIRARADRISQAIMDSIRLARELNTDTPAEIKARLKDVGKQMNGLKKEMSRLEACTVSHAHIIAAWEQYDWSRTFVEDAAELDTQILQQYKSAYAVLEHNQILTDEAFKQLQTRHQFQQKKLTDYQKRMSDLKRQYRGLKRLDALVTNACSIANGFYISNHERSLDEIIQAAEKKKSIKTNTQQYTGLLCEEYTKG